MSDGARAAHQGPGAHRREDGGIARQRGGGVRRAELLPRTRIGRSLRRIECCDGDVVTSGPAGLIVHRPAEHIGANTQAGHRGCWAVGVDKGAAAAHHAPGALDL